MSYPAFYYSQKYQLSQDEPAKETQETQETQCETLKSSSISNLSVFDVEADKIKEQEVLQVN